MRGHKKTQKRKIKMEVENEEIESNVEEKCKKIKIEVENEKTE